VPASLFVEQNLPFARRVASDVRIPDKGRLVVAGGIAELTDELVQKPLTA
jgi:urea transport system ATP-binding protein